MTPSEAAPKFAPKTLLMLCKCQLWAEVIQCISDNPMRALEAITMENNNSTSLLHQVITSKSTDMNARYKVIKMILSSSPNAAAIPNGYGSLPLHVVSQRNMKMDAKMKEQVILALIEAYPSALLSPGGVGKRTPLHIAFTDYLSSGLIHTMIQTGRQATAMADKNGWLPIHVACSRHCSPEKLLMLLEVYPKSLHMYTRDGETPMSLATSTATNAHPNHKLIKVLRSHTSGTTTISRQDLEFQRPPEVMKDFFASDFARKQSSSAGSSVILNQQRLPLCRDQNVHRNLHSDEDKEQAMNLLLLQSGNYLKAYRFPAIYVPCTVTVTPSPFFPYASATTQRIISTSSTSDRSSTQLTSITWEADRSYHA